MKGKILLFGLIVVALLLSGCPYDGGNGQDGREGLSFETAIVIEADNEEEGIGKEYDWLYDNACEGRGGMEDMEMQELQNQDDHWFDLMHVRCGNGETVVYYFQIDSFFGRW